jgi:hypothetical protein
MAKVSHTWKELTIQNGKVMSATPGKNATEYLPTPEVKITGKKDVEPERDDPRVAFGFQLNCAPDPIWKQIFAANLNDVPPGIIRPELKVDILETNLRLVCLASHLDRTYRFVKDVIEATNSDYQEEKDAVSRHVTAAEEHRRPATTPANTKVEMAREKLAQLEL